MFNSTDRDRLIDTLIGEAVLSLLKEHAPINSAALLIRLRSMQVNEKDQQRKEALETVIIELSNSSMQHRSRKPDAEKHLTKGVVPLLSNQKPTYPKKIH